MILTVVGPRVFVRPEKLPDTTTSGLAIVHDRQAATMKGQVVAVGNGPEFTRNAVDAVLNSLHARIDNKYVHEAIEQARDAYESEHVVTVGDTVLFSPDTGEELIFEKDLLVCLREDDILAIVE